MMKNIYSAMDASFDYQERIKESKRVAKRECHPIIVKHLDIFFERCIKLDNWGRIMWDQATETWTPLRLIEVSKVVESFCNSSATRFNGYLDSEVENISKIFFNDLIYDLVLDIIKNQNSCIVADEEYVKTSFSEEMDNRIEIKILLLKHILKQQPVNMEYFFKALSDTSEYEVLYNFINSHILVYGT